MSLTISERTIVALAMSLPGRASDIALAGTLPILAVEVAVREAKRIIAEALRSSQARHRAHRDLLRPLLVEPTPAD